MKAAPLSSFCVYGSQHHVDRTVLVEGKLMHRNMKKREHNEYSTCILKICVQPHASLKTNVALLGNKKESLEYITQ